LISTFFYYIACEMKRQTETANNSTRYGDGN